MKDIYCGSGLFFSGEMMHEGYLLWVWAILQWRNDA